MNNSSDDSTDISQSLKSVRKPMNPLLLTSSSENTTNSLKKGYSNETFCSSAEAGRVVDKSSKISSDLFSEAPSSNLNGLIKILSTKKTKKSPRELDISEIVSTACQRPSNAFSIRGFSQDINDDICLSDPNTDEDEYSSEEVIEVLSSSTDNEYEQVEARINHMTSSLGSRQSRSTLGRRSRMERFLKDVSQNLENMSLEDDFKMKSKIGVPANTGKNNTINGKF